MSGKDKNVPSKGYIAKADAHLAIQEHFNEGGFAGYQDGQELLNRITELPAADVVEVRHGRWKSRQKWNYYVCSECSFENKIAFPYCPNCGARMDGER